MAPVVQKTARSDVPALDPLIQYLISLHGPVRATMRWRQSALMVIPLGYLTPDRSTMTLFVHRLYLMIRPNRLALNRLQTPAQNRTWIEVFPRQRNRNGLGVSTLCCHTIFRSNRIHEFHICKRHA